MILKCYSSVRKSSRSKKGRNPKYDDQPQLPSEKKAEKKRDPSKEALLLKKQSLHTQQLSLLQKAKELRLKVTTLI